MKYDQDESTSVDPNYHQNRLQELTNQMSDEEYAIFLKYIQFRTFEEMLDNMKNLKQTSADVWTNILNKLKAMKAFSIPKGEWDANDFIEALLPLAGAFAAAALALKMADKKIADSDVDENAEAKLDEMADAQKAGAPSSVILEMCKNKTDGFTE